MNLAPRRLAPVSAAFFATAAVAFAHPGPDDGPELPWDFTHLADHPAATALCALVLVTAVWGAAQLAGAFMARRQSLRTSAAKRGK